MCFSATASFTAGITLSVLGVATLKQVPSRREFLLGTFPLLFAIQQFSEGLVWLTLGQDSLNPINALVTYNFLFFATVIWPILCPLAVYLLEPHAVKRKISLGLAFIGIAFGIYLFGFVLKHGVDSARFSGNLLYDLNFIPFYEGNKYLYLIVTAFPFLLASELRLKLFGAFVILCFAISELFYKITFVSVWCFFAAVLSAGLYFIVRGFKYRVNGVIIKEREQVRL
jgi:hypothetical protein